MPLLDIYAEAKSLGLEIDNYESDLYLKCGKEADALVEKWNLSGGNSARKFICQTDSSYWWDIPFQYSPYWEAKDKERYQIENLQQIQL